MSDSKNKRYTALRCELDDLLGGDSNTECMGCGTPATKEMVEQMMAVLRGHGIDPNDLIERVLRNTGRSVDFAAEGSARCLSYKDFYAACYDLLP